MDIILTLILSCSLHPDDNLVQALAYKLSVANPLFVGDLSNLETHDSAKTIGEARQIVDSIKAHGGRPAVGYLAIPVEWAERFGRTTEDLFDGCTNIGIGTAVLADFYRRCDPAATTARSSRRTRHRPRDRQQALSARRACILRKLEGELNIHGVVEHVLPVAQRLDAAPADRDVAPPGAQSGVFPESAESRLLLSLPPARPPAGGPPRGTPASSSRP